jgi:HD superfamily phosphohydrolase
MVSVPDVLHGEITLREPLLVELYHSRAVQRLAHIYQAGITAFINPRRNMTRLDHSLGVVALLQRLKADLVEQAAGLIHDVPHTAFSHVIDFVFPNHEHDYHERQREQVIASSDLPAIFERHGLDWRWVAQAENFSLLERPLPALCADRLDYSLRDAVSVGLASAHQVTELMGRLAVRECQIVVQGIEAARRLSELYLATDDRIYTSTQEVGWYAAMAQALRAALEGGVLGESDLWQTDRQVMARLRAAHRPEIDRWLALLRPEVRFVRDDDRPDLVALPKVRAIDPPVLVEDQVRPLAELDSAYAARKAAYLAGKAGKWGLRVETGP